jgi:hypothetical protein
MEAAAEEDVLTSIMTMGVSIAQVRPSPVAAGLSIVPTGLGGGTGTDVATPEGGRAQLRLAHECSRSLSWNYSVLGFQR